VVWGVYEKKSFDRSCGFTLVTTVISAAVPVWQSQVWLSCFPAALTEIARRNGKLVVIEDYRPKVLLSRAISIRGRPAPEPVYDPTSK